MDGNLKSKLSRIHSVSGAIAHLDRVDNYPDAGTDIVSTHLTYDVNDNLASAQLEDGKVWTYHWEGPQQVSVCVFDDASPSETFYMSWEEAGTSVLSTSSAKTGNKVYNGSSVNLDVLGAPAAGGGLRISYYHYSGGTWTYVEQAYTSVLLTHAGATWLDEVRIFPPGALSTSYQMGFDGQIISQTDSNGITTKYELDSFGRLYQVEDNDRNVRKEYNYNYGN